MVYFHVVFTLPAAISAIAWYKKIFYAKLTTEVWRPYARLSLWDVAGYGWDVSLNFFHQQGLLTPQVRSKKRRVIC